MVCFFDRPPLIIWLVILMLTRLGVLRPARRSTSGFHVYLGDNLMSWSSKRQHVVSRFLAEVEYRG